MGEYTKDDQIRDLQQRNTELVEENRRLKNQEKQHHRIAAILEDFRGFFFGETHHLGISKEQVNKVINILREEEDA